MKGIVVFYINFESFDLEKITPILKLIKSENQPIVDKVLEDGYSVMFVATQNEASRVEKIDFDMPFPRYIAPHMDITKHEELVSNAIAAANSSYLKDDKEDE